MKQISEENKQLLLKDLSARLPYGIKIHVKGEYKRPHTIYSIDIENEFVSYFEAMHLHDVDISDCVPYLRPMSSMTEEEKKEFNSLINGVEERCINAYGKGGYTLAFIEVNDWLNAHHFDYRGLIEKGLALEVPVVNIPFVQVESSVSHAESHSKPEDYEGVTAHANNTK